jgi:hypothetical protein
MFDIDFELPSALAPNVIDVVLEGIAPYIFATAVLETLGV